MITPARLPGILPLFPLEGVILLRGSELPLNIFEPRYLTMVEDALNGPRLIGVIQPCPRQNHRENPLYKIGGAGSIVSFRKTDDGRMLILLKGLGRFSVAEEAGKKGGYRRALVSWGQFAADLETKDEKIAEALLTRLKTQALKRAPLQRQLLDNMGPEQLVNFLAMGLDFNGGEKQALLECPTADVRAEMLLTLMSMGEAKGSVH